MQTPSQENRHPAMIHVRTPAVQPVKPQPTPLVYLHLPLAKV